MRATKENCRSAINRLSSLLSRIHAVGAGAVDEEQSQADLEYLNEFLAACEADLPSEDDQVPGRRLIRSVPLDTDEQILNETLRRR